MTMQEVYALEDLPFSYPVPPPPVIDVVERCREDTSKTVAESLQEICNLYWMRSQNMMPFTTDCVVMDHPEVLLPLILSKRVTFAPRGLYVRLLVEILLDLHFSSETWSKKIVTPDGIVRVRFKNGVFVHSKDKTRRIIVPRPRDDPTENDS